MTQGALVEVIDPCNPIRNYRGRIHREADRWRNAIVIRPCGRFTLHVEVAAEHLRLISPLEQLAEQAE